MIAVSNTTLANELLLAIRVPLQTPRLGRIALFIVAANRCIRNTWTLVNQVGFLLPDQISAPSKARKKVEGVSSNPKVMDTGKDSTEMARILVA